jgi:hypothetical protein
MILELKLTGDKDSIGYQGLGDVQIEEILNLNFSIQKPTKYLKIRNCELSLNRNLNNQIDSSMFKYYDDFFERQDCEVVIVEDKGEENFESKFNISFKTEDDFYKRKGIFRLDVILSPNHYEFLSTSLKSTNNDLLISLNVETNDCERNDSFGFYLGSTDPIFTEYFKLRTTLMFSFNRNNKTA